ncbi:MAG: alpha/beta hydrolase [Actinobacteria bacterium]|nr:alpha/beta hydrolase [Actinomycetota bacterium]
MSRFEKIYKDVPQGQKNRLMNFRKNHNYYHLNVGDRNWKYLACGNGRQTVVLLPGTVRSAELWSRLISEIEEEYRIIAPTYPAFDSMREAAEGVAGILREEKVENIFLLGSSFGGWLAQVFVRKYPRGVEKLILSNTSGPESVMSKGRLVITGLSLPLFPEWVLKRVYKKNYLRILSDVGEEEKAYWRAFMTELLYLRTTREEIVNMYRALCDYAKNYRFSPGDLESWNGETLIIESANDIIKEDARKRLKELYPQARVKTFRSVGHNAGYIAPPVYVETVKEFFSRV